MKELMCLFVSECVCVYVFNLLEKLKILASSLISQFYDGVQ